MSYFSVCLIFIPFNIVNHHEKKHFSPNTCTITNVLIKCMNLAQKMKKIAL